MKATVCIVLYIILNGLAVEFEKAHGIPRSPQWYDGLNVMLAVLVYILWTECRR